ncbi:MAG: hypothetical protein QM499_01130 [Flavobacteriaceae bacterium]
MSWYSLKVRDRLLEYMQKRVLSFTMPNPENNKKNYLVSYGRGSIVMNTVGLSKIFELNRSEQSLFLALLNDIKFSNDYIDGFCCEFVYSRFKAVRSNKTVFYNARSKFIKLGLIEPIDGFSKWYVLNEHYIIKGKVKNKEFDYDGNMLNSNNCKGK